MARNFTTTSDYLSKTSAASSGSVGTVSVVITPNWNSGDSVAHGFWHYGTGASAKEVPSFQKFSDNNIYIGYAQGGDEDRIVVADTGLFSSGVSANHVFTWDDGADEEFYYIDNVQKGSRTLALVTIASSTLFIGGIADDGTTLIRTADAKQAEFARWNRVLSAGERAGLAVRCSPLLFPNGLQEYKQIFGRSNSELDIINGETMTVVGAPAQVDHPRTIFPSHNIIAPFAAAGGFVPYPNPRYALTGGMQPMSGGV